MSQITVYATKDATMLQEGDKWSGYDLHLPVGTAADNSTYRSVVYFPINFTGMTSINSVTLNLKGHKVSGVSHVLSNVTRTFFVRRMTSDWGEGDNNGENVFTSGQDWNWTNRSAAYTQTGEVSSTITGGIVNGTLYTVDITAIGTAWFNGSANRGIILMAQLEVDGAIGLEFRSRNYGTNDRPYVVIDYEGNVAPNAPINLQPTGNELINSLIPTFSGTASDPDEDNGISAYQLKLFADDGTTLIWDSGAISARGIDVGGVTTYKTTFGKQYSGTALSGNTFYKWQGRTRDAAGLWGPYSALQRFKLNTPPNPPIVGLSETPVTDINTLSPTINVTHSDNDPGHSTMYGYRVILETSAGVSVWDSGDIDTSGAPVSVKSFTYSGPSLSWRTNYRIKARTKDAEGVWGNYSGYLAFKTHSTAAPISLEPSNEEVISGLVPTFSAGRGDSDDTITSYQIILYADDAVTVIWDSGTLSTGIVGGANFSKVYTGSALSYDSGYKWKARVTGSMGGTSSYSALATFNTPFDSAIVVQNLPTPNNSPTNTRVTSLTPTFGGTRTTAFTHYQIELYPESSTSANLGTPIWDSGDITQASATSFSKLYNGSALSWNTTYKWRVRVGTPTLGSYTGLAAFTTDSAGVAIQTAPTNNSWITTLTPTFTGTTSGGDQATAFRIQVFEAVGSALVWDSGNISQAASSSWSKVYDGPTLIGGHNYKWHARYTKSTGVVGDFSGKWFFRTNGAPYIPTQLVPVPGDILEDTLFPTFKAYFDDPDKSQMGDLPTTWTIIIRNADTDAILTTKNISTGLNTGLNEYTWTGSDLSLAYNTEYKWETRFTDSKGAVGATSSGQIFRAGISPTVAIVSPSNGSNINTTKPTVIWTFNGDNTKPQSKYRVRVFRSFDNTLVYDSRERVSTEQQFVIPTGYINRNGEDYEIELRVWDVECLSSNVATSTVELQLNAPPRIEGLSPTIFEELSLVRLEWDASSLGSGFVTYVIYRRRVGETDWSMIGTRKPESTTRFNDWYAGQGTVYEYRVTVVKMVSDEPDLESPDSDIAEVKLESDIWIVVGKDRADEHIFELPVSSESHTRPVQQEVFEPIGSNRKAVVRGFVLGHEGSLTMIWLPEEVRESKEKIDYILFNTGPHILKSPFGDVFDVVFSGPDGTYIPAGSEEVTIAWIETGSTNQEGLTPDEFLASIGAE